MKTNPRTLLAIALFVPFAAILLTFFACLPVPIGNPETSKIDEPLSGIYLLQPSKPDDKTVTLAILRPWDSKTYLLQYFTEDEKKHLTFKCWLTAIAGKTFITCQPMDDVEQGL